MVPADLTEEEKKYIYKNGKGKYIFTPIYEKYNELFFDQVIENMGITVAYNAFKDTAIYERYMLNTLQFSAAKSASEAKLMQSELFDGDKVKSYDKFSKDVEDIAHVTQETWLRVEYETARRQTVAGAQFASMQEDADLYPYWVYRGVMDDREREEHVELEGQVFRIGDPDGDAVFPPDDFNCRCTGDPVDDQYLDENKLTVNTNEQAAALLKEHVAPEFQYNAAVQGPMPNDSSYADVFHSANDGNAEYFGLPDPDDETELTGLAAKGLQHILAVVMEWRRDYHVDQMHNIVFQNKKTLTNVRLADSTIHEIAKHSRGFENIPATIEKADEIWMHWENPKEQRVVLRNYLLFGRSCYMVKTKDGKIIDAFAVSRRGINKYRKGVIVK